MLIGAQRVEDMTPEQRRVYDAIASGPRRGVPWPFLAMLDAPRIADAIQAVGEEIRFSGQLSPELKEVAILATAAAFGSGYEWSYHLKIARDVGVHEATLASARSGVCEQVNVPRLHAVIITICRHAVLERKVDPGLLRELVEGLGRQAATEILAITGYYQMLALFLSAGELDTSVL